MAERLSHILEQLRASEEAEFCSYCPFDGTKFVENDVICRVCCRKRIRVQQPVHLDKQLNGREPWKKLLYIRQPYPDSYVDREKFLDYLIRNVRAEKRRYLPLCRHTMLIGQQAAFVASTVALWASMRKGAIASNSVLAVGLIMLSLGFALWVHLSQPMKFQAIFSLIMRGGVIFGFLKSTCPIIETLTRSCENGDVIMFLSAIMFVVHLITFDYAYAISSEDGKPFTGGLALNGAVFGSVLLASRLDNSDSVFSFLFIVILLYSFSTSLRRSLYIKKPSYLSTLVLTPIICSITYQLLLIGTPWIVAQLYAVVTAMVIFLAPLLFIRAQKYKTELRGPWDVPEVHVS